MSDSLTDTSGPATGAAPALRGLVVDWGGVLTSPLSGGVRSWCESDGIDYEHFRSVMRELARLEGIDNPVHALERGELVGSDFERDLAARLRRVDGGPVPGEGLLARMFQSFSHESLMYDAVRRVRSGGVRTALLSNSWGNDYPRHLWDDLFDVVVISGEVRMRKPDPEIYLHTCAELGLRPPECVFVDDLPANVRGAAEVGLVGVRHVTSEQTVEELEALFGRRLRD